MSKYTKDVLHKMKNIYYKINLPYIDWMGFLITEDNCPTYHHIIKSCELDNDDISIENGAYLGKKSHELLHRIEQNDINLYNNWNDLFRKINDSKEYPNEVYLEYMYLLQEKSIEIDNKRNKVRR